MRETTILIIEDELIIAKDLQNRLESEGYNVPEVCINGEEAMELIEIIKPDMVLIDIQLESQYDGIETAEKIRLNYNLPVIYMTAHVNNDVLERIKLTQPSGFLMKPINYTELSTSIELGIYKHKIESQNSRLLDELQAIIAHSNILRDMTVPICSKCSSIREDNSNWISMEDYMKKYYNIEFTESVCPTCLEKMFPTAYNILKNREKKIERSQ